MIVKILKKNIKWFQTLSNPKKIITIIIGYFVSIYIYSLMNVRLSQADFFEFDLRIGTFNFSSKNQCGSACAEAKF